MEFQLVILNNGIGSTPTPGKWGNFQQCEKNLRSIKQPNPKKAVRMTQPMTSRQTVTMENAEIEVKHNLSFRSLFNLNYLDEIDTLSTSFNENLNESWIHVDQR